MRDKRATVDMKIRFKEALRSQVEAAAKERGVSMNAEMVSRLERTFREDELLARLERIEALLTKDSQ